MPTSRYESDVHRSRFQFQGVWSGDLEQHVKRAVVGRSNHRYAELLFHYQGF